MDFDNFTEKWEAEKAFWARWSGTKTYEFEHYGAYSGYSKMQEQVRPNDPHAYYCAGDWVRSEDYRRDVEKLERKLDLCADIVQDAYDNSSLESSLVSDLMRVLL